MKPNDFDLIAPFYDQLARLVFGSNLRDAQTYFLNQVPLRAKVLVIGGGTGFILKDIWQAQPQVASIDYVEASAKMLSMARKNCPSELQKRVQFIHGTEESLSEGSNYDLIFTAFFLDVFSEERLPEVMEKLKRHLNKKGIWMYTDFQLHRSSSWLQHWLVDLMHFFFRLSTNLEARKLNDTAPLFESTGLSEVSRKSFFNGLIHSVLYSFF